MHLRLERLPFEFYLLALCVLPYYQSRHAAARLLALAARPVLIDGAVMGEKVRRHGDAHCGGGISAAAKALVAVGVAQTIILRALRPAPVVFSNVAAVGPLCDEGGTVGVPVPAEKYIATRAVTTLARMC